MKILIALLGVAVIILLALLFFKHRENVEHKNIKRRYQDSLRRHEVFQAQLKVELQQANASAKEQERKDSIAGAKYRIENARLRNELRKAHTPRVEQLIDTEPELRWYLVYYDSLLNLAELRIDSMEVEARMKSQMVAHIADKTNTLMEAKDSEIAYLRGEVATRDKIIEEPEKGKFWKALKRAGTHAGSFAFGFILGKSSG